MVLRRRKLIFYKGYGHDKTNNERNGHYPTWRLVNPAYHVEMTVCRFFGRLKIRFVHVRSICSMFYTVRRRPTVCPPMSGETEKAARHEDWLLIKRPDSHCQKSWRRGDIYVAGARRRPRYYHSKMRILCVYVSFVKDVKFSASGSRRFAALVVLLFVKDVKFAPRRDKRDFSQYLLCYDTQTDAKTIMDVVAGARAVGVAAAACRVSIPLAGAGE